MKKIITVVCLLIGSTAYAVQGYNDIYIDREQDIVIHGVMCGADLKNLRSLKPSYVFTNTAAILKGTYYYDSPYGNYSLTFNTTGNVSVMARGLLKDGQTKKEQMAKSVCIVSAIKELPAALNNNLKKLTLKANDQNWDKVMTKYTFVSGKPAYGKGVFQDARKTAEYDKADKEIFSANQAYLKGIEAIFSKEYTNIASTLPKKLKDAINYAHKTDGVLVGKTYPSVKEPVVWTPTAKERYNDLNRQRSQTIAWDKVIQENFDWLFSIVGKGNDLKSTQLISKTVPQWNGRVLQQLVTVQAKFESGKALELDFLISSSKVDSEVFDTMEIIKQKSHLVRNNPIASSKKPRSLIKMPTSNSLDVYTPTEKEIIFFSLFRNKKIGDTYRYK